MTYSIKNTTKSSRLLVALLGTSLALVGCTKNAPATVPPQATAAPVPLPEPDPVAQAPTRAYPPPPTAGTPKAVNFPNVAQLTLKNGLRAFVVENHEVPIVSVQLVIRAGEMDANQVGGMTAAMLGEGTRARSKAQIDQAIEFVGGSLGAGASTHATYVFARMLSKDLRLGLTLAADEVMNPTFPEAALTKLKEQYKASLKAAKSQPATLATTLFDHVAYPEGHPYGRLIPTEADVDAIKVADLKTFHNTFYKANNAFIVLAGDITPSEAKTVLKRTFGRWASADSLPPNPLNKFKNYATPKELTIHLVDRPASAQAEIIIGNLALARNHADWAKLQVANSILGDDAGGRLFRDIREDKGLTYGVYSRLTESQAPGTFAISTRTQTQKTGKMLAAVFGHIKRMRNEAPTAEEVQETVDKIVGKFPLEIETANQIAAKMRSSLIFDLPTDYWRGYRDTVAAVRVEDVQMAAKKYIHPVPHVVIVGKASKIEPQLLELLPNAKIVRYDAELNKL